jgi:putative membrane protein
MEAFRMLFSRVRRLTLFAVPALLTTVLTAVMVATPARAQTEAPTPQAPPLSAVDRTFLQVAHTTNLFEIQTSRLALERSTRADIRALARMFIVEHGQVDARIVRLARASGLVLANELPAPLRSLRGMLRSASGRDFDRLWIAQQVPIHAQTILLTGLEQTVGSNPQAKAIARDLGQAATRHLQQLLRIAGTMIMPGSDARAMRDAIAQLAVLEPASAPGREVPWPVP